MPVLGDHSKQRQLASENQTLLKARLEVSEERIMCNTSFSSTVLREEVRKQ